MAKNKQLVTPIGTIKFPKTQLRDGSEVNNITIPANYDAEIDKNKVSWTFALAFSKEEGAEVLKELATMEGSIAKLTNKLVKADTSKNEETDKYEDNGGVLINFKSKFPPKIVDAAKTTINGSVGFGSKARIVFSPSPYDYKNLRGITCWASIVQVTELSQSNDLNILGDLDIPVTTDVPAEEVSWEE